MANLARRAGSGLISLSFVAASCHLLLLPPVAPERLPSAAEIAEHALNCNACQLPTHGQEDMPSKRGLNSVEVKEPGSVAARPPEERPAAEHDEAARVEVGGVIAHPSILLENRRDQSGDD